ncbi:MAG: hypothetical protein OWR52_04130 [Acidibacillus sp.]|nr:hypothetical protein [Acidibacillus sp.]
MEMITISTSSLWIGTSIIVAGGIIGGSLYLSSLNKTVINHVPTPIVSTKPSSNIQEPAQNNTASSSGQSSNNNNAAQTQNVSLSLYKADNASVLAPSNWSMSTQNFADGTIITFTNSANPNEQEIFSTSDDAGSYMSLFTSSGKLEISKTIPKDASSTFVFNNGLSEGYTYSSNTDSYTGYGVTTVANDKSSYGNATVFVPLQDKSLATEILNSLKVANLNK